MFRNKIPASPLEKIALSCSGGGYRAAIFHLGTMAYLAHLKYKDKPLIENMEMISTVSGGTITGAVYAIQTAQGQPFKAIYTFLVNQLHQVDLVREALNLLNPDIPWPEASKTRNLINAFALLYDQYFTMGSSMHELNTPKQSLRSVVFNATDFSHALNFRFRTLGSGHFGNAIIRVPRTVAAEVKIADAIATSACFPGGFEPMQWPQDFRYAGAKEINEFAKDRSPIGLMDGGIYDNQGIDSILAFKSRKGTYFDLIIVSDVSSPDMTAYKPSILKDSLPWHQWTWESWQHRIQWLAQYTLWILFSFVILFTLIPFTWGYDHSIATGICIGLGLAALLFTMSFYAAEVWLRNIKKALSDSLQEVVPPFYRDQLSELKWKTIPFGELLPLLLDRVNSLKILLSEVFLKIVRRLNYHKLYSNNKYEFRRVSNLIKGLLAPQLQVVDSFDITSSSAYSSIHRDLHQIVLSASRFGTTLWFTEDEQLDAMLDKLVVAGQAGICYQLMKYLEEVTSLPQNGFQQLPPDMQHDILQVLDQCRADWANFQSNPYYLHQLLMSS